MFIKFITSTVHVYIRVSINVLGLLAVWSAKLHCMYIYIKVSINILGLSAVSSTKTKSRITSFVKVLV